MKPLPLEEVQWVPTFCLFSNGPLAYLIASLLLVFVIEAKISWLPIYRCAHVLCDNIGKAAGIKCKFRCWMKSRCNPFKSLHLYTLSQLNHMDNVRRNNLMNVLVYTTLYLHYLVLPHGFFVKLFFVFVFSYESWTISWLLKLKIYFSFFQYYKFSCPFVVIKATLYEADYFSNFQNVKM